MSGTHRFPTKDNDFNTYLGTAVTYLVANMVRLGMSAANKTALLLLQTTWNGVFPLSQNPSTRTTTITQNKNDTRTSLEDLLTSIFEDIPDSVLTNDDRNTLRIPKRKPGEKRPKIEDTPFTRLVTSGGALLQFQNRVENDSSRPSRHADADGVEVAYKIHATAADEPASPDDCNKNFVDKKSKFDRQLNVADAGKLFSCFTRWVNLSDASKNSPWSLVITVVVPK